MGMSGARGIVVLAGVVGGRMINLFLKWWIKARLPWSRFRRRFMVASYPPMLPEVKTVEEIEGELSSIKWTMDNWTHLFDSISSPTKVWWSGKGDCDDISILASALLKQLGIKSYLLTVMLRPIKKSHTVCVFRDADDYFSYFDNAVLKKRTNRTLTTLTYRLAGDTKLVCWNLVDPETLKEIKT